MLDLDSKTSVSEQSIVDRFRIQILYYGIDIMSSDEPEKKIVMINSEINCVVEQLSKALNEWAALINPGIK